MIFSMMVFFVFSSIQYNEQIEASVSSKTSIVMKVGGIAIIIFTAIFMWYSNTFFTRRRKKEIGIYSLVGLSKRQIGKMLFYENMIMGIFSLGIGIFLGSLFSKAFAMMFLRMMGHYVHVNFFIPYRAVINTTIIFLLLTFIISIHSYTIVYRFKLIDLFAAQKKGERRPKGSVILAIISIAMIIGGYVCSHQFMLFPKFSWYVMSVLGLVIGGTYVFFKSFMVFVIKGLRKNKNKYYSGLNMIGATNLLHKIRGNATILATIAILSATTLSAVGTSYSFYYNTVKDAKNMYPFSYVYEQQGKELDDKVDEIIEQYPENSILHDIVVPNILVDAQILESDMKYDIPMNIMSESKFNEITKARGLVHDLDMNKLENDKDGYLFIRFMGEDINGKDILLKFNDMEKTFKIKNTDPRIIVNQNLMFNTFVVKDSVYEKFSSIKTPKYFRAIEVANENQSRELTEELNQIFTNGKIVSYYYLYVAYLESTGMLMFLGGFIGLVILLSTGSVIYFRLLMESKDDQQRYKILRNIGVSNREIKASISRQILFLFVCPLIIGIMHSTTALSALSKMLQKDLTMPIIITTVVYIIIYCMYYLITVKSYNNIMNLEK